MIAVFLISQRSLLATVASLKVATMERLLLSMQPNPSRPAGTAPSSIAPGAASDRDRPPCASRPIGPRPKRITNPIRPRDARYGARGAARRREVTSRHASSNPGIRRKLRGDPLAVENRTAHPRHIRCRKIPGSFRSRARANPSESGSRLPRRKAPSRFAKRDGNESRTMPGADG